MFESANPHAFLLKKNKSFFWLLRHRKLLSTWAISPFITNTFVSHLKYHSYGKGGHSALNPKLNHS